MLLGGCFDLDTKKTEIKALQAEMEVPGFWQDIEEAKRISKRAADLQQEVTHWEELSKEIQELLSFALLTEKEQETSLTEEITQRYEMLKKIFAQEEFTMLFSGPYDLNNAIVSFHAGSGGTEAQDWAQMLLRMILRFSEKKHWEVSILWDSAGQEAGIKSATIHVQGRYAYGYLRSEAGVHRLVRISPFDADKSRHTSFALVEVLPEIEDQKSFEIQEGDIRVDTFRSGGAGGQSVNKTSSAVRMVHIPTGITVVCQNERSQQQNREMALKILTSRLHHLQQTEQEKEKQELRGEYKSAEWGNQIRSYVLQPYQLVKDHRTNTETSNTNAVLEGDLEPFIEAYLRKQHTA